MTPSTKHWITQNDRIIDCSIRYEFKLFFALLVEVCRCCLNEIVEIQRNTQKYLPIYFDLNTHCKSDLWQMHLDACWISSFSHGLKKPSILAVFQANCSFWFSACLWFFQFSASWNISQLNLSCSCFFFVCVLQSTYYYCPYNSITITVLNCARSLSKLFTFFLVISHQKRKDVFFVFILLAQCERTKLKI